jgi:Myb-like DNA-binding domain
VKRGLIRSAGKWTAEEESRLTEIVKSLGWVGSSSLPPRIPWTEVARLMDQKRTATQCRNKWYAPTQYHGIFLFYIHRYDYMVPAMLNDGKSRRWSVADTFILVHK